MQHLAPVIEAVSDASSDIDVIDDASPSNPQISSNVSGTTQYMNMYKLAMLIYHAYSMLYICCIF